MKKSNANNLRLYVWQIVFFVAATVFSLVILIVGYNYYSTAQLKVESALQKQAQIYNEIEKLTESKHYLDTSSETFARIQTIGFFANEDRLSWGEALNVVAEDLKLPSLKYSIRPQETITNIGDGFLPSLKLSESIMDIDAGLLHEADFITLSKKLSEMPGLFKVIECELLKNSEIVLTEPSRNINLKCSLGWYTAQYKLVEENMYEGDIDPVDIL